MSDLTKRSGDGAGGAAYAKQLRRKKPSQKYIWHLDEVVVSIGGRKHWLWRAVDQDGYVLAQRKAVTAATV
ncbi:transposase-like protein [Rhizobium lentis]|uniref:Transposase-like protein n=1 Tax=Rhizobium lentis TaxID=1138194 RepID=A0A7W9CWN8_9HYPH|nr:transposase-like protein [Rhizobium lentis]MBB5552080.1 transposase-like protein [Rhizobium lentis]MBB5562618.1 transposase-like protein [Rhizobium lentis]MBB5569835.1 transposase-like protein [Rhizobium lentis]